MITITDADAYDLAGNIAEASRVLATLGTAASDMADLHTLAAIGRARTELATAYDMAMRRATGER